MARSRITSWIAGSPLASAQADIDRAFTEQGLPPELGYMIARKESGLGSQNFKVPGVANSYNPFGYNVHGSSGAAGPAFRNYYEAARAVASDLRRNYIGKGINTIDSIIARYAPPSENNTSQYQAQLKEWSKQLGLDPTRPFTTGPGGAAVGASAPAPAVAANQAQNVAPAQTTAQPANPFAAQLAARLQSRSPVLAGVVQRQFATSVVPELSKSVVGKVRGEPTAATREAAAAGDPEAQKVVSQAQARLGMKYVWGGGHGAKPGPTGGGLDCSGLTREAWAKVGVDIGGTTYDQIKTGRAVNPNNWKQFKPGDLLFPHAGHVLMYIGNGKAIHAPQTGDVVREVPVTSRDYMTVRRPVG